MNYSIVTAAFEAALDKHFDVEESDDFEMDPESTWYDIQDRDEDFDW
jgi:hypothetical protein